MSESHGEKQWELSAEGFVFGPFRLSGEPAELFHGEEPLALTPKAIDTLRVLVESDGRIVTREELMERVWPEAFVEEAVLTQNVYTLRKVLAEIDPDGSYIETIPRRGYRFLAPVEREGPASSEERPSSARRSVKLLAGLLAVAAVVLIALRAQEPDSSELGMESIAVLPFVSLQQSEESEALGLGMADALIVRLTELDDISVRPTSSVRSFADADRDPSSVVRTLGVDGVVDGSIQRSGEGIRVSVQLIGKGDAAPIWADSFDAEMTDIFEVQDSIAERVASALQLELAGEDPTRARNIAPDAYQAYLTGRYLWNRRTGDSLGQAISSFEQALEVEPDYARAHAGLADSLVLLPLYGSLRPAEAFPRAISEAATALSLDPNLAEAHNTLAYARFLYEWDWARSESGFRRAIELNRDYAPAHHWYGYFLASRARHDEAIARIEQARSLDPVSRIINADAGLVLYFGGRFDEAETQLRSTLDLEPDFAYARFALGMVLEALGRTDEAIAEARLAAELSGGSSAMLGALGRTLGAAGRVEEAGELLDTLLARAEQEYVQAGHIAMIYTGLRRPEALDWWRRAVSERSRFVPFFRVWPVLAELAADPAFDDLESGGPA